MNRRSLEMRKIMLRGLEIKKMKKMAMLEVWISAAALPNRKYCGVGRVLGSSM
jgi:hypothetical protein